MIEHVIININKRKHEVVMPENKSDDEQKRSKSNSPTTMMFQSSLSKPDEKEIIELKKMSQEVFTRIINIAKKYLNEVRIELNNPYIYHDVKDFLAQLPRKEWNQDFYELYGVPMNANFDKLRLYAKIIVIINDLISQAKLKSVSIKLDENIYELQKFFSEKYSAKDGTSRFEYLKKNNNSLQMFVEIDSELNAAAKRYHEKFSKTFGSRPSTPPSGGEGPSGLTPAK